MSTPSPSPQFLQLPEQKQGEIVRASLKEFAQRGYDIASTNRIVLEAGISKGALFKYFTDKEALFLYTADLSLLSYMEHLPNAEVDDFFEWLRQTTVYKLKFMREHPLTYQLWVRILKEPQHQVYAKALSTQTSLAQQYGTELKAVLAADKLRPNLTWKHVWDMVSWIGFGLQERFMGLLPDVVDEDMEKTYQSLIDELDVYLDIIRFGIYREESE